MNTLVVFMALFSVVLSVPVSVSEGNNTEDGLVNKILDLKEAITDPKVTESDITYWFFNRENPTNGIAVNKESTSTLNDTSFTITRDTMFLVHGWQNTNTSAFVTTVRQAVLNNLDVNVFVVDWSIIAAQEFIPARYSVPKVGRFLANFIDTLVLMFGLPLSRTTLVGHSLGGHVVGNAGAALDGKISVIVGLDPALPLFLSSDVQDRLDRSDAKFVQVIHTNGGLKGFLSPLGHSDYYPNGGVEQPGCGNDLLGRCAHRRAFEYYAESLGSSGFVGVSCESYMEFSAGRCDRGNVSVMGTYQIDTSASGSYYLDTNSEPPFAKGQE